MPKYTIPVFWSMANDIEVEADSLEEAIKAAKDYDLPQEGAEYIDGSFTVNRECAEALECNYHD